MQNTATPALFFLAIRLYSAPGLFWSV